MIVRDEEDVLEQCLLSAIGAVDEIVIVDTGSVDTTPDIAQQYAHVYDQMEWTGFAAARNRSLELATGDVIVILDADEQFSELAGWEEAVDMLSEVDAVAFAVENSLPRGQILRGDVIWQPRMWLNRKEIRYSGSVHNQNHQAFKQHPLYDTEPRYGQGNVRIKHDGYNLTKEEKEEKYRPRLPLLLDEIAEADTEKGLAYYEFQTANAYFMLGEHDKMVEHARNVEEDNLTHENLYSLALMGVHACSVLGLKEEAARYSRILIDVNPDEPLSFFMMGLMYAAEGKKVAAYNYMGAALAQTQLPNMDYKYVLDTPYIAAPIGEAALRLNRLVEAKSLFDIHLEVYKTPEVVKLRGAIKRRAEVEAPETNVPVGQQEEAELEGVSIPVFDEQIDLPELSG